MPEFPNDSARSSEAMFAEVYDRLKTMATRHLSKVQRGATLDTTMLVHELYLRMESRPELAFEHEAQFFSYAARAMRHLLTDRARGHLSQRAGGDWMRITLTASNESFALKSAEQVIALDGALEKLAAVDARAAQVIELRYFAGLTAEQVAEVLTISKRTADRDWAFALAFLKTDLD